MGLWLLLGGKAPVPWTRSVSGEAVLLSLRAGWNLVGWTGDEVAGIDEAVEQLGDKFVLAALWDVSAQRFVLYDPGIGSTQPLGLRRGDAMWVGLTHDVRWWERGAARPEFRFGDHLSTEEREAVQALFEAAEAALARSLGVHTSDYTVSVSDDHPGCAVFDDVVQFPFPGCNTYAAAHEYFHVLQNVLARDPGWGPGWLTEGSAEYAQHLYELEIGVQPLNPAFAVEQLGRTPGELHDFNPRERFLPYVLGFLASQWLVDHAGEESLAEFYRLGRSYSRWEDAFNVAFGIAVEHFYREFEGYRKESAPLLAHLTDSRVEPIVVALSDLAVPAADAIEAEIASLSRFYGERFGAGPVDYSVYVVDTASLSSTFLQAFGVGDCVPLFSNHVTTFISDCPDGWRYPIYRPYEGDFYTSYFLNRNTSSESLRPWHLLFRYHRNLARTASGGRSGCARVWRITQYTPTRSRLGEQLLMMFAQPNSCSRRAPHFHSVTSKATTQ